MLFISRHKMIIVLLGLLFLTEISAAEIYTQIKNEAQQLFCRKLQVPAEQLKINFTYIPENLSVNNASKLEVFTQKNHVRPGEQAIWVQITDRGKIVDKFPISVDVSIVKDVVVARQRINRGSALKSSDLKMEKRVLGKYWQDYFFSLDELQGCEAKQLIKNGLPVTKRMVRQTPLIERGQSVKVEIHSKTMTVTFTAIAMDDGFKGDRIKLQPENSSNVIQGVIATNNLVVLYQE